jgi:uncharacterized protein (DUF2132 family)
MDSFHKCAITIQCFFRIKAAKKACEIERVLAMDDAPSETIAKRIKVKCVITNELVNKSLEKLGRYNWETLPIEFIKSRYMEPFVALTI